MSACHCVGGNPCPCMRRASGETSYDKIVSTTTKVWGDVVRERGESALHELDREWMASMGYVKR